MHNETAPSYYTIQCEGIMRASRGIGSRILQGGRVRYPCPAQSLAHAIALGIYGENRARDRGDRISLLPVVSTSERAPKDGIMDGILGWFVVPVREIAKCPRPGCFRVQLYVRRYVERVAFGRTTDRKVCIAYTLVFSYSVHISDHHST